MAENKQVNGQYGGFNIVPRSVVKIGGTPFIPIKYNLITNVNLESDSFSVDIPLDSIDIKPIIKALRLGESFFIELWNGYVSANKVHSYAYGFGNASLNNVEHSELLLNNYEKILTREWVGIVLQYEVTYGDSQGGDVLSLQCGDFSQILGQYSYEKEYKDASSRAINVVNDLNKNLQHFEFKFKNVPTKNQQILMGYQKIIRKDKATGEYTEKETDIKYRTEGKTYLDIIREITRRTTTKIMPDIDNFKAGNKKLTYYLVPRFTGDKVWTLHRENNFKKITLRGGLIGKSAKSEIIVELRSVQSNGTTNIGSFPEQITLINDGIPDNTVYRTLRMKGGLTVTELQEKAKDIALSYAQFDMTGTLDGLRFIGIKPNDNVIIMDNRNLEDNRSLKVLAGDFENIGGTTLNQNVSNFTIKSITSNFDINNGIQKTAEIYLNLALNFVDLKNGKIQGMNLFPTDKKIPASRNNIMLKKIKK